MNISPVPKLPMGCEDFRTLIDEKFLFVDKTLLIKELIDDGTTVSLITRPRRFGKTLNLSMLHYFFAEKVLEQPTKGLFNGLKISQTGEQYMAYQGQYPVISVSLKRLTGKTYEIMLNRMRELISFIYRQHLKLLDSPYLVKQQKNRFEAMLGNNATEAHLEVSLLDLAEYLHTHYKKKVIILIDEYDTPIQSGYFNGYYSKVIELMREFLGNCLKTNPYLKRAVLTGITRVSKESLFSGLNNIAVYSLLNRQYKDYFGFTEKEVNRLACKMNYQDKLSEMKAWYNGYEIGGTTLYNPWSIISCMKNNGLLQNYWLNTSGNELVKKLLINSSIEFKQDFESLLRGKSIHKFIREDTVFSDLEDKANESLIWSLFLVSGYLKIVNFSEELEDEGFYCELSIPNREIHCLYCLLIKTWLRGEQKPEWYKEFIENLLVGKTENFEADLKIILENIVSSHDVANEKFYHGLVLGFLSTLKNYEIKSNRESGRGRYDIAVIPNDSQALGLLFELKNIKKTASNATLIKQAKKALQQIDDKNYVAEFKQRGICKVLKIALVFKGKDFQLKYVEENLKLEGSV